MVSLATVCVQVVVTVFPPVLFSYIVLYASTISSIVNTFPIAGIGRQVDGGRNSTHRTEALELPANANHARYDERRWKILSRERVG